ncbi:MAG: PQQ-binding-like beta-propeller repeat protein [Bacteroidota bacterium]
MLKPIIIAAVGVAGVAATLPENNIPSFPSIETRAPLLWKTKMGAASFRSNVLFLGNKLYIGSNGDNFRDYGLIEKGSGVYAIDRKSGKAVKHFADETFGDMDVNGLLIHNNRLYFGNDNEEFLCTDLDGKLLWRNPTSGDIEHEPVLIKTNQGATVVYAAESGEIKAVDPQTGNARWSYYVPDFKGWKPGDNRSLFKVKAWFSNGWQFFTKPLVEDLNKDGVQDLIYCGYGGTLLAINGNSGKELWHTKDEERIDEGVALVGTGANRQIVGLRTEWSDDYKIVTSECVFFSLNGKKIKSVNLEGSNGGNGLNFLSIDNEHVVLNSRTKTYLIGSDSKISTIDRSKSYIDSGYLSTREEFRNGYNPLFANRTITLDNGKKGLVVLNQHDYANYKDGFLEIVSLDDFSVIERISFPSGSEMPPVIEDVNQDGKLDILISGYDGYLYCYQLPKY